MAPQRARGVRLDHPETYAINTEVVPSTSADRQPRRRRQRLPWDCLRAKEPHVTKFMMLWRFLLFVLLGQLGLVSGQSSASSPAQLIAALPSCAVSV